MLLHIQVISLHRNMNRIEFSFRYKLLLEDVIKNTPESHNDKANLREALTQIEAVAWHINEQLRDHENR